MRDLTEEMWPCNHIPEAIIGDWGALQSHKADKLVSMLSIRIDSFCPIAAT